MQNIRISSDAIIYQAKLIIHLGIYVIYVKLIGMKINFVKEVFDDVRYKVCMWRRMFWLCRMKTANDVYFQSCELMFRGLIYYWT